MCVHGAPVLKRYTLNLCLMEHNAEQAASAAKPERFNSPSTCREAAALDESNLIHDRMDTLQCR